MPDVLNSILERISIPANLLLAPAPSDEHLDSMIRAAVTAPDHAALRPWRFIVFRGAAREKLADIFGESARRQNPALNATELDGFRQKALRAPLVIASVAVIKEHPKVPADEQLCSAAAATQNLQLAANALGYGSIWVTGQFATDPYVCEALGLSAQDRIIGFVHLGTPSPASATLRKKLQNRPLAADFIVNWPA